MTIKAKTLAEALEQSLAVTKGFDGYPVWIQQLELPITVAAKHGRSATLLGTMIGLLDYCRQHMPKKDWQFVLEEFTTVIKTPPGL